MDIPQINIGKINKWIALAGLMITLVITLVLYWPTAGFAWITGLDQELIIENTSIHHLSVNQIIDLFFSSTAGRYMPLTFLSYATDLLVMPVNPIRMVHIVNVVLHLLNILLLFRLLKMLSRNQVLVVIAVMIFALHPLNLESVAWISSRGVLLGSFFLLSATLMYEYAWKRKYKSYKILVYLLYTLALFSHLIAVVFPIVVISHGKYHGMRWRNALGSGIPFMILAGLFLMINLIGEGLLISDGLEGSVAVFSEHGLLLRQFFAPFDITGIQYKFMPDILMSAYLPLLILSPLFAWGFVLLAKGKVRTILITCAFAAWFIWITIVSFTRISDWKNSGNYWNRIIELHPQSSVAYFHRGDYHAIGNDFNRAKFDYVQSIKLDPGSYMAMNNLGLIYLGENDFQFAIKEFENAISLKEDFFKPHLNLGLAYMRIGNNDLAMERMTRAIELNPSSSLAYYNRGLIYERDEHLDDAIEDFTTAIELDPNMYIFYKDRGKALVWKRRFAEAELDFSQALVLDDSDPEMWFRRSLARVSQDKFREGLEDALVARSLGLDISEDYIKGLTRQILEADSILMK